MIKRITDISSLSGVSSPLLPLIYADFNCTCNDNDGVFIQLDENDRITTVFSLKNSGAVLVKNSSSFDSEEVEAFFGFSGVNSVVSDCSVNSVKEKPYSLLICKPVIKETQSISCITMKSGISEYESVYALLSDNGSCFDIWFPAFSKKINMGIATAVYKKIDNLTVSTAVCTAIFKDTAIISGVFTTGNFRNKGCASECMNELMNCLYKSDVEKAYLWCENKNISFYNKLGFTVCGQVYVREEF